MSLPLVPGRECGPCNVCCTQPAIIDPELKKAPGVLCSHWAAGTGCTIYEARSKSCRGHFCAWRQLPQFDESWRPDHSNIYVEMKSDPPEHYRHVLPDADFGFKFTLLGDVAPERMSQLIVTSAALIQNDVPVILALAAPPGHLGCHILLNPALKPHAEPCGKAFTDGFTKAIMALFQMPPEKMEMD
ncbi:hypothetical protein FHS83_003811 [Rhizomicrobium palustre]|uniref:Zinc/iron-chelating domain-containing protein n=1 Tax=Rhizomicrobium palustre TaxID=189966 RepID=A0A846N4D1_9PROT|nr:hypothetical protein [Rhizomicrobium palustre]NIK90493.1 hypothetical protein [Rhizomicrobium palustre]